jgi:hypothetical protein
VNAVSPLALRFLTAVRRARLLAVLAGLAWLLGVTPSAGVRILLTVMVAVALGLDAMADAANASRHALSDELEKGERR